MDDSEYPTALSGLQDRFGAPPAPSNSPNIPRRSATGYVRLLSGKEDEAKEYKSRSRASALLKRAANDTIEATRFERRLDAFQQKKTTIGDLQRRARASRPRRREIDEGQ